MRNLHKFNDYKLIQERYLRNSGMMNNVEQLHPTEISDNQGTRQMRHYRQTQRETKTDK